MPNTLLWQPAATTIDELYRDLHVAFRDGSGRQGAVRSVAPGSIATVELGALGSRCPA